MPATSACPWRRASRYRCCTAHLSTSSPWYRERVFSYPVHWTGISLPDCSVRAGLPRYNSIEHADPFMFVSIKPVGPRVGYWSAKERWGNCNTLKFGGSTVF
jgi:hypothetical protein